MNMESSTMMAVSLVVVLLVMAIVIYTVSQVFFKGKLIANACKLAVYAALQGFHSASLYTNIGTEGLQRSCDLIFPL